MRNFIFVFVCFLLTTFIAEAQSYFGPVNISNKDIQDAIIYGPANLKQVNAQSLTITGPLEFNDLKVKGVVTVHGPIINSQDLTCKKLLVTGPLSAKHINCDDLAVIGTTETQDLVVKRSIDITSSFTGKKIKCATLVVTGTIDITDFNISEDAKIIGHTKVSYGSINDVEMWSNETILQDVELNNITINKNQDKNNDKNEHLYLKGKTLVKGNITFISGKGIIIKGPNVQINGKVSGAVIKSENT